MNMDPKNDNELEETAEVARKDDAVLENGISDSTVSAPQIALNNVAEMPKVSSVNAQTASRGSGTLPKALAVIALLLLLGIGLVVWKAKFAPHRDEALNHVTKEDMQILLKDANPMQLKAIGDSPEQKKKIADSLRQLLAVASQAKKDGIADDPNVKNELESIRSLITASLYDKKINEGKAQMPPFSFITEDQIKDFWSGSDAARHEGEFKQFLDSKIALAKEGGKFPQDKELTEEETKQAKDDFAKIKIYEEEAKAKSGALGEEFNHELDLQVKLQQAQFLASRYAQKVLTDKVKVTDDDVKNYIASHPEFDTKEQRAKAEQVLSRAKAGEDFAKLAKEFSEDPGSKDKGGLYENVAVNSGFDKNFESAALALQPGQVTENLVETPFGYHIIKLEKKGEGKDAKGQPTQTYDVRHILIGTTVKDPNNPMARPVPVAETVKDKLEEEKQKQVLDEITKNNPIEVDEDFTVPAPSEEQIKQMQMMQQQQMQGRPGMPQGMPPGADEDAPPAKTPVNPAPKKK